METHNYIQNKYQNMQKSAYKCSMCNGTNYNTLTAAELQKLDANKYKDIIENHKQLYGSINAPSQGYSIPCIKCNGGYAFRVKNVKDRANIPQSFYDKRLSDFDWNIYKDSSGREINMSEKKSYIESFINDFEKWEKQGLGFYIYSEMKGSGKTFLASCICNSLIDKYPIGTRFVAASQLLDIAKNSNGSGDYEHDQLALLCNCKLLVIDDIGQKNCGTDWMNDVLFQIVDARYQKKIVTIFTSNMNMQQLSNAVDDRIADRINRMTIQLTLPNYAVRAKEANEQKLNFLKSLGIAK